MLAALRSEIKNLVIFQRKNILISRIFRIIDNKNVGIYDFMLLKFIAM